MREELLSVGIDIGTSTTQLIFSKLIVENEASAFTVPRISIVDKEIIYRSDVYFTPLISNTIFYQNYRVKLWFRFPIATGSGGWSASIFRFPSCCQFCSG